MEKTLEELKEQVETHSRLLLELTSKIYALENKQKGPFKPWKQKDGSNPQPSPESSAEDKEWQKKKPIAEKQLSWLRSLLAEREPGLEDRILKKYERSELGRLTMWEFNEAKDKLMKDYPVKK